MLLQGSGGRLLDRKLPPKSEAHTLATACVRIRKDPEMGMEAKVMRHNDILDVHIMSQLFRRTQVRYPLTQLR
jgi:hypothetical protein